MHTRCTSTDLPEVDFSNTVKVYSHFTSNKKIKIFGACTTGWIMISFAQGILQIICNRVKKIFKSGTPKIRNFFHFFPTFWLLIILIHVEMILKWKFNKSERFSMNHFTFKKIHYKVIFTFYWLLLNFNDLNNCENDI